MLHADRHCPHGAKECDFVSKRLYVLGSVSLIVIMSLAFRIMAVSTYASVENSLIIWIATILPMTLFFVITVRYSNYCSSSLYCLTALLLSTLNSEAMPLLEFTSAFSNEQVLNTANMICKNTLISLGLVIIIRFGYLLVNKISAEKKKTAWIFSSMTAVSFIMILLIIIFGDRSTGTSMVVIGNIISFQIAIPVCIISIIELGLSWNINCKTFKLLYVSEAVILNLFLILMGETGIPLITFIAFVFFYYFLQEKRIKLISFGIPLLSALSIAFIWIIHILREKIVDIPMLSSISDKIEIRIFSSDLVDQIQMCMRSISAGGIFGSVDYTQYLPEASSDFSFATITHYNGFIVVLIVITIFVAFLVFGMHDYTKKHKENNIQKLVFSFTAVIFIYNILMCVGIVPVLGVQIPFTGTSKSFVILNAFLLGVLTSDNEFDMNILEKVKEVFTNVKDNQ